MATAMMISAIIVLVMGRKMAGRKVQPSQA
jgi:hypothetical protein